jgi:hypothetical protein
MNISRINQINTEIKQIHTLKETDKINKSYPFEKTTGKCLLVCLKNIDKALLREIRKMEHSQTNIRNEKNRGYYR